MNKDFARGMIVSLALKSLPVRKKSPIAYLYNGVRLPALPEWDREAYPYAFIWKYNQISGYQFIYMSEPAYGLNSSGSWSFMFPSGKNYFSINSSKSSWNEHFFGTAYDTYSLGFDENGSVGIVWANFDVINEDGSVYLAASEPVPVYE